MSADLALLCEGLHAGNPPVWVDLNLRLERGQALVVAGGGRGKFMLFQIVLGQVPYSRGTLRTLGQDPQALSHHERLRLRSRCMLAPHNGALIANLSIADNVALPLRYHGLCPEEEVSQRVAEALDASGMGAYAQQRPATLSPEQRRIVGVARVAAVRPELILVQDPDEGLDDAAATRVHHLLQGCLNEGSSALLTTQLTRVEHAYDGRLSELCGSRILDHNE